MNRVTATAAFAAAIATAGCERAGPARVSVPPDSGAGDVAFELAGPGGAALMLDTWVNGTGPYRFVLDTGATLTCIDGGLAGDLDLQEVRGVQGTGAGVSGQGAVRLVTVDSLRMGAVTADDLQACVLDLQHLETVGLEVDGLIGLNVLREFRVTLDFDRGVVTFESTQ